jgi:acyl-CoA reductase LuxC
VVLEGSAGFEPAPPARFARLYVVDDLEDAVEALVAARGLISTVGVAGWEDAEEVLAALAPVAPGRVCALGTMQRPPAGWNHEGASDLAALVRWMEWEGEER